LELEGIPGHRYVDVKDEKLVAMDKTIQAHHKYMSQHERDCCQSDYDRLVNCQSDPTADLHWADGGRFLADDEDDGEDESEAEEKEEMVELRPRTNLGRQTRYPEQQRRRYSVIGQFVAYQFHYVEPQSDPEPFRVGRLVGVLDDGYVNVRHYHSAYRKKGAKWKKNLKVARWRVWTGAGQNLKIHRPDHIGHFR
jgi:hypothetical protein